jgi:hypothetical protein
MKDRRKSIGGQSQKEWEKEREDARSRRSSRSRVREEDLPTSYAELAKHAYKLADQEGWTTEKTINLLMEPQKLAKELEHVNLHFLLISTEENGRL